MLSLGWFCCLRVVVLSGVFRGFPLCRGVAVGFVVCVSCFSWSVCVVLCLPCALWSACCAGLVCCLLSPCLAVCRRVCLGGCVGLRVSVSVCFGLACFPVSLPVPFLLRSRFPWGSARPGRACVSSCHAFPVRVPCVVLSVFRLACFPFVSPLVCEGLRVRGARLGWLTVLPVFSFPFFCFPLRGSWMPSDSSFVFPFSSLPLVFVLL